MGYEERRDRDRDHVVEHLAPGGKEADHLVEGMACEARRAARLGVAHRALGVGQRGGDEVQAEAAKDLVHTAKGLERPGQGCPQRVISRTLGLARLTI